MMCQGKSRAPPAASQADGEDLLHGQAYATLRTGQDRDNLSSVRVGPGIYGSVALARSVVTWAGMIHFG